MHTCARKQRSCTGLLHARHERLAANNSDQDPDRIDNQWIEQHLETNGDTMDRIKLILLSAACEGRSLRH